jgi:hypothetical protein
MCLLRFIGQQFMNNGPPMKSQPVTFNQPPYGGGPAYNFQQQTRVNTNQYQPPPMQAPMQQKQQPLRPPVLQQQPPIRQRTSIQQQQTMTKIATMNQKPPVSPNTPPIGMKSTKTKTVGEQCPTYRYTVDNNFVEFHTVPGNCKM